MDSPSLPRAVAVSRRSSADVHRLFAGNVTPNIASVRNHSCVRIGGVHHVLLGSCSLACGREELLLRHPLGPKPCAFVLSFASISILSLNPRTQNARQSSSETSASVLFSLLSNVETVRRFARLHGAEASFTSWLPVRRSSRPSHAALEVERCIAACLAESFSPGRPGHLAGTRGPEIDLCRLGSSR